MITTRILGTILHPAEGSCRAGQPPSRIDQVVQIKRLDEVLVGSISCLVGTGPIQESLHSRCRGHRDALRGCFGLEAVQKFPTRDFPRCQTS